MANVLDYLLPQSFMSDVQTVFQPKKYEFSKEEFLPGLKSKYGEGEGVFNAYNEFIEQGNRPTQELIDILSGQGDFYKTTNTNDGFTSAVYKNRKTGQEYSTTEFQSFIKNMFNNQSGMFHSKDAPNLFSGESMAQGFERAGLSDYDPAMTKPLKLSSLRNLDAGSYTGELESKRATLAQGLQSNLTQASQIGSGFAGYGQRDIASSLAKNQYSQGIEGVYQGINQQRATALQGLYSSLDDMRGLISKNNG